MLASVNCLEEALLAQAAHVDIIDLKQPKLGALGALEVSLVQKIVTHINKQTPISATIGDLPMQTDIIVDAINKMANTKVDYIKIGFFPSDNWADIINDLKIFTDAGLKLIAVLFADQQPDIQSLTLFSKAGFHGVMLDTMNKSQGSLTQVMPFSDIQTFVKLAKQSQLLCGLAGSLRTTDIAKLSPLQADYLGFRGALCEGHQRTEKINPAALQTIKAQLC